MKPEQHPRLPVRIENDTLLFGESFSIVFNRTLRIPDDGKAYPLPPGLGNFPIKNVTDYGDTVPKTWLEHGGVFIPMYQREAMWMSFRALKEWKPSAVKIAVGMVNAISGETWSEELVDANEDYIVVPPQPWLDGINAGDGMIKQFVAMPLGMGYTVEGQVYGEEKFGGIQLIVYEAKEGRFHEPEPVEERVLRSADFMMGEIDLMAGGPPPSGAAPGGAEMGIAAGGKMKQKIYPDPHGIETWDETNFGRVYVHIVNSMMFRDITGEEAPPTPVSASTYTQYGYPWFDLYDEHVGDIKAPEKLKRIQSIKEIDKQKGFSPQQDDSSVEIPEHQTIHYKLKTNKVKDGEW